MTEWDRLYGNLDATPEMQDWTKAGSWDLPRTVKDFRAQVVHENAEEWAHFKTLPAYKAMPPDLARQVDQSFGPRQQRAIDARRSSLRDGGR